MDIQGNQECIEANFEQDLTMKDLSLHILDIFQNSIRAGARSVTVELSYLSESRMILVISDNGKGMDEDQVNRVKDPFYSTRTTRRIGLGLSLLTQKAEQTGGYLGIQSEPGIGTKVIVAFQPSHPDCPPFGDIPGCAWMLMASNPQLLVVFKFAGAGCKWEWDSVRIQSELEGIPVSNGIVRNNLLDWFNSDFTKFKEIIRDIN